RLGKWVCHTSQPVPSATRRKNPSITSSPLVCSPGSKAAASLDKDLRKGFNTLVIFVTWILWKHRNACVFDSVQPQAQAVLSQVATEGHMWCLAGATGLQRLLLRRESP
ncbi:hypothetical protein U9M48_019686, partial [Paspalum notatum var. saurae]